jgi:hypothetical protein
MTQDQHLGTITETLLNLYLDLPANPHRDPSPGPLAEDLVRNARLLNQLLGSPAFRYVIRHLSTREKRPLLRPLRAQPGNPNRKPQREAVDPNLCRLHALTTPALQDEDPEDRQFRGQMRELVYTAANFSEANDWGPFRPDGTVDWVLTDALSTVMCRSDDSLRRLRR